MHKNKLSIMLALSFLYIPHIYTQENKSSLHKKFSNVLLVIHYNSPHYASIDFFKNLYSPYFQHIVFYGEQEEPNVIAVTTNKGYYFSRVVEDVLVRYPNHEGYLFLQDDCVLNVWNCGELELDKIWLPFTTCDINNPQKTHVYFNIVYNLITGIPHNNWITELRNAFKHVSPQNKQFLDTNLGENVALGSQCDMFYIPSKFRAETLKITPLFKDVFCEMAIPCMLCSLDLMKNWEGTCMLCDCRAFDGSLFNPWPEQFTCYHPVKFSNQGYQNSVANVFNTKLSA